MSRIEVTKGQTKGGFRVLVNWIQHGCEIHSPVLANQQATQLKERVYPTATLVLITVEKT
jgi:hypothetical protein